MAEKQCFLLAPIGASGSEVSIRSERMLTYVIKPVVEKLGYQVLRADQITASGIITSQVTKLLLDANLIIADLSSLNPNVMYELGIAHAMARPVIQITTDFNSLPFDISVMRSIVVDLNDIESIKDAQRIIELSISDIEAHPECFDSPVSAAIQVRTFEKLEKELTIDKSTASGAFINILKNLDVRMKSLEHVVTRTVKSSQERQEYSRRVFLVHVHDDELKNEMARFLERLDFEPIILHEQPDKGQTIFAKLNGELADVGFAFVILTPDDVGALASQRNELKGRARQNVVFEQGLFAGHLSPRRVCAIRRGDVEIPSDLHRVLYKTVPEGGNIRSIALELANELRAAGYILDANKLLSV